jgi:hypothetical protein
MPDQNIQIKVRNEAGEWDNLMPRTTPDQVIGLMAEGMIDPALLPAVDVGDTGPTIHTGLTPPPAPETGDLFFDYTNA